MTWQDWPSAVLVSPWHVSLPSPLPITAHHSPSQPITARRPSQPITAHHGPSRPITAHCPSQPIAHRSPALCSLLGHGLAGHLLSRALVSQRAKVPVGSALFLCVSPHPVGQGEEPRPPPHRSVLKRSWRWGGRLPAVPAHCLLTPR